MAPVNPTLTPTNDPNYLLYSRPIKPNQDIAPTGQAPNRIEPTGNRHVDLTQGLEYKEAGDLVSGITQTAATIAAGVDSTIKADIEHKVYQGVDTERSQYTDALETIKGVKNLDLLNTNNPDNKTPDEVANVGNSVAKLKNALAAGKISNTYYYSRLNDLAVSLRNQFPGYRSYIDSEISKVTGVNPANAYMSALVSDINRSAEKANSMQKMAISMVEKYMGIPGSDVAMTNVLSGKWGLNDVAKWAAPRAQTYEQLKLNSMIRADQESSLKMKSIGTGMDLTKLATNYVHDTWDSLTLGGGQTPAQIEQSLIDRGTGKNPMSDNDARAAGERLAALRETVRSNIVQQAINLHHNQYLSPDEFNKRIDGAMKHYDNVMAMVYDNNFGGAVAAKNWVASHNDDATKAFYKDSETGDFWTKANVISKISGQYQNQFFTETLKSSMPDKARTFLTDSKLNIESRYNPNVTIKGEIQHFQDTAKDHPDLPLPQINDQLIGEVDKIGKPNNEVPDLIQLHIAHAAFSPANRHLLDNIPMDGIDPATGKHIKGKYAVFTRMTSPQVTNKMYTFGQGDPTVWNEYKGWAEGTFAEELFSHEINDLNNIEKTPGMQVSWDSDNTQWILTQTGTGHNTPGTTKHITFSSPEYSQAQRSIFRLNQGLRSIKNIAEAEHSDPNLYVLQLMVAAGYRPGPGNSIPQAMLNAIITTQQPNNPSSTKNEE